jgi:predicted transcriptional regulator with HTH domain
MINRASMLLSVRSKVRRSAQTDERAALVVLCMACVGRVLLFGTCTISTKNINGVKFWKINFIGSKAHN